MKQSEMYIFTDCTKDEVKTGYSENVPKRLQYLKTANPRLVSYYSVPCPDNVHPLEVDRSRKRGKKASKRSFRCNNPRRYRE